MKSSPYGLYILGNTCATMTKTTFLSNYFKKKKNCLLKNLNFIKYFSFFGLTF